MVRPVPYGSLVTVWRRVVPLDTADSTERQCHVLVGLELCVLWVTDFSGAVGLGFCVGLERKWRGSASFLWMFLRIERERAGEPALASFNGG